MRGQKSVFFSQSLERLRRRSFFFVFFFDFFFFDFSFLVLEEEEAEEGDVTLVIMTSSLFGFGRLAKKLKRSAFSVLTGGNAGPISSG